MWLRLPPTLDEFADLIGEPPLFPYQREVLSQAIPFDGTKVFSPEANIIEVVLAWGKGSGKDTVCVRVNAWGAAVALHLVDAFAYFGLTSPDPIDFVNCSVNTQHAKMVYFTRLQRIIRSGYFDEWQPKLYESPTPMVIFRRGGNDYVRLLCGNSETTSFDGYNPLLCTLDEADAFAQVSGKDRADEIGDLMLASMGTRYGSRGYVLKISYTRVQGGYILRELARANAQASLPAERRTMFGDLAPTWTVNPRKTRDDPDIASMYTKDPELSDAMFACKPPEAVDAFFRLFPGAIDACTDPERQPIAQAIQTITHRKLSNSDVREYVALLLMDLKGDRDTDHFIHLDTGLTGDSAALCCLHREDRWRTYHGVDSDPEDGYLGEVVTLHGMEYPRAHVVYRNKTGEQLAETYTDDKGRHSVSLAPGWYSYSIEYAERAVPPIVREGIEIAAGMKTVDEETGLERFLPFLVEDLLLEWRPDVHHSRPVDFINIEEVLAELCTALKVRCVSFDKWNSATGLQRLCERGVYAIDLSFGNPQQVSMFRNLKTLVYGGNISLLELQQPPWHPGQEPWRKPATQLKRLTFQKGIKIDHQRGEGKDIADARAAAAWMACQATGGEDHLLVWE